jgi:hypothetical protein
LHPDPYYSKFPAAVLQRDKQCRYALTQERGGGAACRTQDKFLGSRTGGSDVSGQSLRQLTLNKLQNGALALLAFSPAGKRGIRSQYLA